jgi:hypothetical protein
MPTTFPGHRPAFTRIGLYKQPVFQGKKFLYMSIRAFDDVLCGDMPPRKLSRSNYSTIPANTGTIPSLIYIYILCVCKYAHEHTPAECVC